ncbi:LysR family transcriptional regulator [Nakamurella lactea]|uniref:LysR family transcriptional regulator n=1 Tax=Nakamurella lactea TaxID=459515 RepID=UPI00041F41E4|nr:LysR family transcriptional regulator [Nakamurella lactea]
MEPRHLRSFLAVVQHRTVTDAAIAVRLAPSSLSAHIRALEAGLGVSLFIRGPAGMTLTGAGSRLAARAPGLLADWETARREVVEERRRMRIVGTEHVVASQFPQLLEELRRRRPDLEVDVGSLPTRGDVLDQVRTGCADAGMILDVRQTGGDWVLAGVDDQQLEFAELAGAAMVLAVAPSHPLAATSGLSLAELAGHRVAIGPKVCAVHVGIERVFPQLSLERLPSLVIARSWAVHGLAAVMLPKFAVASEFAAGTLVPVPVDTRPLDAWLRVAWRPGAAMTADLRDVLYAAGAAATAAA